MSYEDQGHPGREVVPCVRPLGKGPGSQTGSRNRRGALGCTLSVVHVVETPGKGSRTAGTEAVFPPGNLPETWPDTPGILAPHCWETPRNMCFPARPTPSAAVTALKSV